MSLFNPKLQAYVVGIVDGQRMLVQLAPGAQINVKRNWDSPMDALDGLPPRHVTLTITAEVVGLQVWEDGANPEDLAQQREIEAPKGQIEQ